MNTPVSFPIAKLLKEKGFDAPTLKWYHRETKKLNTNDLKFSMNKLTDNYSAPNISEVVMWCFDKYGIWVYADYYNENRWFGVFRTKEGVKKELFDVFNTPIEAYEAAIDYTLNNLI